MSTLPKISSYGQYSSDNYGAHTLRVDMPNLTVWFSYQTPVAFIANGGRLVVRQNEWGPTTGKHLNWIEQRTGFSGKRVSGSEFEAMWNEATQAVMA